ncbi:MAG: hypothetical protein AcusKO_05930 [Acuticoccus sp.]
MSKAKLELAAAAVFTGLVVVALYLTSRIDLAFSKDLINFAGPRAYPAFVLGALLVMSCVLLVQTARKVRGEGGGRARVAFDARKAASVVAVFAASVVFAATFEPVGYLITVPAIMLFIAWVTGGRSLPKMLVTSVALAILCLIVFRYGLNTVMPEGILGIDAIF